MGIANFLIADRCPLPAGDVVSLCRSLHLLPSFPSFLCVSLVEPLPRSTAVFGDAERDAAKGTLNKTLFVVHQREPGAASEAPRSQAASQAFRISTLRRPRTEKQGECGLED